MKRIFYSGLVVGMYLFVVSYGGLYLSIRFFPSLFVEYINPLFNSDGSRDLLFYLHAFVISLALAWVWQKTKILFNGSAIKKGMAFGASYALVGILPVMWITFSSLDITLYMVLSWFVYGLIQSVVAGYILAKVNP